MKGRWRALAAAGAAAGVAAGWLVRREGARPEGLDDARYILLTTYREDGSRASTPVWFTRGDGGTLEVASSADSPEVERIRRDPRVELTPCDVRGGVEDGVEPMSGVARIVRGEATDALITRIADRYGWLYRVGRAVEGVRRRGGGPLERVGLRITLTERLGEPPSAE